MNKFEISKELERLGFYVDDSFYIEELGAYCSSVLILNQCISAVDFGLSLNYREAINVQNKLPKSWKVVVEHLSLSDMVSSPIDFSKILIKQASISNKSLRDLVIYFDNFYQIVENNILIVGHDLCEVNPIDLYLHFANLVDAQ